MGRNQLKIDANFFKDLSEVQAPPLLWIGCSDSSVRRNIANMVIHSNINMLRVYWIML